MCMYYGQGIVLLQDFSRGIVDRFEQSAKETADSVRSEANGKLVAVPDLTGAGMHRAREQELDAYRQDRREVDVGLCHDGRNGSLRDVT